MKIFISVFLAVLLGGGLLVWHVNEVRTWEGESAKLAARIDAITNQIQVDKSPLAVRMHGALDALAVVAASRLKDAPAGANTAALRKARDDARWYVADYLKANPGVSLDLPER